MSAEIIQFMLRPKQKRVLAGFPRLVFRSTARPGDLTADHADTWSRERIEARPEDG